MSHKTGLYRVAFEAFGAQLLDDRLEPLVLLFGGRLLRGNEAAHQIASPAVGLSSSAASARIFSALSLSIKLGESRLRCRISTRILCVRMVCDRCFIDWTQTAP